jgi:hypothetical protein
MAASDPSATRSEDRTFAPFSDRRRPPDPEKRKDSEFRIRGGRRTGRVDGAAALAALAGLAPQHPLAHAVSIAYA